MKISHKQFEIEFSIEYVYGKDSSDNKFNFNRILDLSKGYHVNKIALKTFDDGILIESVLIIGGGGASGLHERIFVIVDDIIYIGVGNCIQALAIPGLNPIWSLESDEATCFGVYYDEESNCLIGHGEIEISMIDLSGNILWSHSGKDIFTGKLRIENGYIFIEDFENTLYKIDKRTGSSECV